MTTFRKLPTSRPSTTQTPMKSAGLPASSSRNIHGCPCVQKETPRPSKGAAFRVQLRGGVSYTTAPSLKIGRYIAMTRPPTSTPRIAMISGSSRLDMLSTALSTSAS